MHASQNFGFSEKTARACLPPHVAQTHFWRHANLWSDRPVMEARLLDMQPQGWSPLKQVLQGFMQALGLGKGLCECLPQGAGRGRVLVEVSDAALGRKLLQQAMLLLHTASEPASPAWERALKALRQVQDEKCMGPSTACIVEAAVQRGLPAYRLLPEGNLVQLGMGAAQQRIWTAESDQTGAIAQDIASDKALTKELLALAGVPTPMGSMARSPRHAWEIAQQLGLPVVVKPLNGNRARGVTLELKTQDAIEAAWQLARREGADILVERFIAGDEHRILVVGGAVVAASRGETLSVVGDGASTVAQLVEQQINQHPRCLVDMTVEAIDLPRNLKVQAELRCQGLSAQSVPDAQQTVVLLRTGNLTADCTDEVHPDIAQYAVLTARTVGLDIAGIDLVVQDIRQPLLAQGGAVVEVNAGPSLLMHLHPVQGTPRPVGEAICRHLFPQESDGRIPVVGILAPSDAGLPMAQGLGQWLNTAGHVSGIACGQQAWVGAQALSALLTSDVPLAQRVLMHRMVTAAVISQSSEEAAQMGWVYPQCDVTVIAPDLGRSLPLPAAEERVLASQLRRVRTGGVAVVQAGSRQLEDLALNCAGRLIWVDASEAHPTLQAHRRVQGSTAFLREGVMVLQAPEGESQAPLPALWGQADPIHALLAWVTGNALGLPSQALMHAKVSGQ